MMDFFNRYDWRTKTRMLWGAALLFLIICYQLAIKPTLAVRAEYHTLQAGEAGRQANLQTLAELREKIRQAGDLFATEGDGAVPDTLLSEPERIALMAQNHDVNVRSLPAPERLGGETMHLNYTEYQLQGTFTALLRLLHDAERQPGIKVLSASFVKLPNPSTRAPELLLQLRTVRLAKI